MDFRRIEKASDNSGGNRCIGQVLKAFAFIIRRNKARKLMLKAKVQVGQYQKYKVTTNSNHQPTVLDNLLNIEFNISPSDIGLCG